MVSIENWEKKDRLLFERKNSIGGLVDLIGHVFVHFQRVNNLTMVLFG